MFGMLETPPNTQTVTKRSVRSTPPQALAFFRIACGVILLGIWLAPLFNGTILSEGEHLLLLGMILMALFLTIGAWFRYVAVYLAILYALELALMMQAGIETNGVTSIEQAALFIPVLLVLAFSGADRAYSYTMYLRYGSPWEWEDVHSLPQQLLKIILALSYLYIGAFLLWQPLWMSGMRLRSALVGSLGTMLGARLARSDVPPAFFQWSLYITKALVLMLPFSLWMKQIRMIFIVIGVLLHVAAGILFGTWWPIILVAGLPLFLVSEISSPKAKVVQ